MALLVINYLIGLGLGKLDKSISILLFEQPNNNIGKISRKVL